MSRIFQESGIDITGKVLPFSEFKLFTHLSSTEFTPSKMDEILKEAQQYLDEEIPFISLYSYREFKIVGDDTDFRSKYDKRRDMLFVMSLAEYYEKKGRFKSKIYDLIWCILEETSWVIPAHASHNPENPTADVPPVYDEDTLHGVDLFSAMTGAILVTVLHYNRDILDELSPIIAERIIYEVKKRVIKPYLSYHFRWSGEYGGECSNWCPLIVSNILYIAAMIEENDYDRTAVISRSIKYLDNYTSFIPDDGRCDEGSGYWGSPAAALFDALEIIYDMTGGAVDVFSHPLLRRVGEHEIKADAGGKCRVLPCNRHPYRTLKGLVTPMIEGA